MSHADLQRMALWFVFAASSQIGTGILFNWLLAFVLRHRITKREAALSAFCLVLGGILTPLTKFTHHSPFLTTAKTGAVIGIAVLWWWLFGRKRSGSASGSSGQGGTAACLTPISQAKS